jgi:hypothetical protein
MLRAMGADSSLQDIPVVITSRGGELISPSPPNGGGRKLGRLPKLRRSIPRFGYAAWKTTAIGIVTRRSTLAAVTD